MEEKKCTKCGGSKIQKLFSWSFVAGGYIVACTIKGTIDWVQYVIHHLF